MNRAVATALSLLVAAMTLHAGTAPVGLAQVPEAPEDKQRRIDQFQDYRLIFEPSPSPEPPSSYLLRQGPDTIYDVDFVTLLEDQSLTNFWLGERNRDWAFWIGTGAVAMPAGTMLFLNNFRGQGPLAFFANPAGAQSAAPNAAQATSVSDWRTFALSVAGAALATYGAYTFSQWVLESLDVYHPNRLDKDSIQPRVEEWNERLRDRLNLDPSDIPPPPSARPSPSLTPSGGPSPGNNAGAGAADSDAAQSPTDDTPSPGVGGPASYPGGAPPAAMPNPLPVVSPGRQSPSPRPMPSVLPFPGYSASPAASPSPRPSVAPSAQ